MENNFRWCITCNGWRNQLLKSRRCPNVLWERTRSWEWPKAYQNIVEVYLPASWQNDNLDLKDISIACYAWENCSKYFNIRQFIIKKLRQFRNQYFAHNTSLKATDLEKAQVFDVLKDLLNDQDVQGHIDVQDCLNGLAKIEQGYQIEKWMNEVQNLLQQHELTLAGIETTTHKHDKGLDILLKVQENIQERQEAIQEDIGSMKKDIFEMIKRKQWTNRLKNFVFYQEKNVKVLSVILFAVLLCVYLFTRQPTNMEHKFAKTACVSEQYRVPFPQDLPLLGYLNEHRSLVGRQWLMEQLKPELFSSDGGKQHGVVLVAEMGYGKSAFISKLLCPGSSESAISIQKHVVAFHVCKFDVRSTHCSERFIRRLIGFFAMKSAEYGNIISMLPEAHIVFNRDSCEKEPDACFDQGITIPIKQLSNHMNTPWIVVIDAVDEYENTGSNPILELLSRRMKHLPEWLKFLVTSRNITSLTLLRKMKIEQLYSNDSRNKNDIKAFIQESFPVNTNPDMINTLVDKSEGNFVYIIQALKWILDKKDYDNVPDFPSDLGDVYEINFDRQFVDAEAYRIPKLILEIVCSTINPVTKVDIYTILRSINIFPDKKDFDRHFASLNFFLRTGESVRVPHQALYRWLIDEQNESYGISFQAGHALISKYMFSTLTGNNTKDIVDLAIHVANSADSTLRKMFVSSTFSDIGGSNSVPLVHKLIWKTSCFQALELLLHHYPDVNIVNEENVTPAFVAASKGHIDQLILLHTKGADLGFTVKGNILISPYLVFLKFEMMKRNYYAGYGMLHIAAQHGHSSIVKYIVIRYILAHNKTLIYEKNALGLHAGHVACESGNLEVMKFLHSFEPKLFGYKCMFYASKQNHITILKWLVQNGIEYNCISDNESLKAAHSIENLNVVQMLEYSYLSFPNVIYSLDRINSFDIWWIVFKTTPLAVAIQTGSMDAARYLIETFPKSLDCYDAYGYTPALRSVFYSRTELYPLLLKKFARDKCGKIPDHLQDLKSFKHVRLFEMAHKCPEGGSLAHIVALYALHEKSSVRCWSDCEVHSGFTVYYLVANKYFLFHIIFELGTNTFDKRCSYRGITAATANWQTVKYIDAVYLPDARNLLKNKIKR